jgi:hypothetical protein
MLLLVTILLCGLLAALVLATFYWLVLRALEPALYRLRTYLHGLHDRQEVECPLVYANNEIQLCPENKLRTASGFQVVGVLAGVTSVCVLGNLQVPSSSNHLLTNSNAWHFSQN